jgi:predicted transcriptional regulator
VCTSLVSKDEVCKTEARGLIDKLFGGSRKALFSALIEDEELTREEIEALRSMIDKR